MKLHPFLQALVIAFGTCAASLAAVEHNYLALSGWLIITLVQTWKFPKG